MMSGCDHTERSEIAPLPPHLKRTGGGRFNREDPYTFFLVADTERRGPEVVDLYPFHLVALNEIKPARHAEFVTYLRTHEHLRVFLDSGVFSLAAGLARERGLSFGAVRVLPPDEIPGYGSLFTRYVDVARRCEADLWGYVEIDLGSPEQKTATRRRLEAAGLAPIPVYHALSDGWDYFDELAGQYDRICIANLGQTTPAVRKRLVATIWERRRYPYLWIHLLGLSMHHWFSAFPAQSSDASGWTQGFRYGAYSAFADGYSLGHLPKGYAPGLVHQGVAGEGPMGHIKGMRLAAYQLALDHRSRVGREQALRAAGFSLLAPTDTPLEAGGGQPEDLPFKSVMPVRGTERRSQRNQP